MSSIMSDLAAREKLRAAIAELTLRLSDLALIGAGDSTSAHVHLSATWKRPLPALQRFDCLASDPLPSLLEDVGAERAGLNCVFQFPTEEDKMGDKSPKSKDKTKKQNKLGKQKKQAVASAKQTPRGTK